MKYQNLWNKSGTGADDLSSENQDALEVSAFSNETVGMGTSVVPQTEKLATPEQIEYLNEIFENSDVLSENPPEATKPFEKFFSDEIMTPRLYVYSAASLFNDFTNWNINKFLFTVISAISLLVFAKDSIGSLVTFVLLFYSASKTFLDMKQSGFKYVLRFFNHLISSTFMLFFLGLVTYADQTYPGGIVEFRKFAGYFIATVFIGINFDNCFKLFGLDLDWRNFYEFQKKSFDSLFKNKEK